MSNISPRIVGLFELDVAGNIRYSRTAATNAAVNGASEFVGRNFFDEIAPHKNVEEFRRRFRYFAQSTDSSQKFNFTCQFDEEPLEVKVLLTQICEREFDLRDKLIIVDIREV